MMWLKLRTPASFDYFYFKDFNQLCSLKGPSDTLFLCLRDFLLTSLQIMPFLSRSGWLELLHLQYYLSDLVLNGFKHGPNIISILHSRSEPGPKY